MIFKSQKSILQNNIDVIIINYCVCSEYFLVVLIISLDVESEFELKKKLNSIFFRLFTFWWFRKFLFGGDFLP